jgi:hypothetical protein
MPPFGTHDNFMSKMAVTPSFFLIGFMLKKRIFWQGYGFRRVEVMSKVTRLLKHSFINRPNWQFQIELLKLNRLVRGKAFLLPTRRSPVHLDMLLILAH